MSLWYELNYTTRTLDNRRIASTRRSRSKVLLWVGLAVIVVLMALVILLVRIAKRFLSV